MTVLAVMLLFAIFITAPGPAILGPETQYELGLREERAPHCRPATKAELWQRDLYPQGKAATYSLQGEYLCETDIFRYGERHSFYDYATDHTAARVGEAVAKITAEFPQVEHWTVSMEADDPELAVYLRNTAEVELAKAARTAHVVHNGKNTPSARVAMRLNRVTDPKLFLEIFVEHQDERGRTLWRAY